MKRPALIFLFSFLPLGCAALGQTPAAGRGFAAYAIVQTRNIFDPDRYASSGSPPPPRPYPRPERRAQDFIVLTGVMVDSGKPYAFFSGSRPDYDMVLGVNGAIAGATVTRITTSDIQVQRSGTSITVAIGQTVPFDGSTPGAPPAEFNAQAPTPAPVAAQAADDNTSSDNPGSPATPSAPANISDVMRRMMERRQQEERN